MTVKRSGSTIRSKKMEDRERTWLKANDAVHAIRELIRSMKMKAEQKITLDDGINSLAKEVESMLDRIDMASSTMDQKKLLAAYKKFLQHNIEVVNKRLKKKD
jgi:ribosomal protein L31E